MTSVGLSLFNVTAYIYIYVNKSVDNKLIEFLCVIGKFGMGRRQGNLNFPPRVGVQPCEYPKKFKDVDRVG